MEGERGLYRATVPCLPENPALCFGQRGAEVITIIDARQRADPVPALFCAKGFNERELHIAPVLYAFTEIVVVVTGVNVVKDGCAICVCCAQPAVINIKAAIRADDTHHIGVDTGEGHVVIELLEKDALD